MKEKRRLANEKSIGLAATAFWFITFSYTEAKQVMRFDSMRQFDSAAVSSPRPGLPAATEPQSATAEVAPVDDPAHGPNVDRRSTNDDPSRPNPTDHLGTFLIRNVSLIPGQTIQPIDLGSALKLAGARDLDIAIARQQVERSFAELSGARALWLPSFFLGPTYYRADGAIQTITGQVQTIDRGGLFFGGLTATANGYAAPSPGTGYPPLTGMTSVLRFSDAIYEPMAARRVLEARRAGVTAATNNAILEVSELYFNLQAASGRLAIAREAASNAERLAQITLAYAQTGQGKWADHHRALAELNHQKRIVQNGVGALKVASANLIRLLVLDPKVVLVPVEPAESIVRMIREHIEYEDLLAFGLSNRPELASSQELVQAALTRARQARLRPFVPSLGLSYFGGGFAGGPSEFMGNFGSRGDIATSLFWELKNLGFGDRALMMQRSAEERQARIELVKVGTVVAEEITAACEYRQAALREIAEARAAVLEAVESQRLNFIDMREGVVLPRATRPIEVLQPIQALVQARTDYLESVLNYNRAQFRLKRAIGR